MSKRKNNCLGKAGITFYTYATERIREKPSFPGDNPGLNKPFCRLSAIRRLASEYREYIPQQLSLDL